MDGWMDGMRDDEMRPDRGQRSAAQVETWSLARANPEPRRLAWCDAA